MVLSIWSTLLLLNFAVGHVCAGAGSVNLAGTRQTIQGFGGSTAWLGALTDAQMDMLFGNSNSNQLGLSILRVRIDYQGKSQWATELSNAKKAKSRGAIVFATPWTPPLSMKTNNAVAGGQLQTSQYSAYASYLQSFVQYMSAGGASLYAISIQNEPDITVTYESCDWTAQQLLNFVKNYASVIGTKVITAESFHFDHSLSDPILNDATAASKISIVGGHIYGSGLAAYSLAQNKGKQLWMTEHYNEGDDLAAALVTAKEIHDCLTVANFNAYVYWWMLDASWASDKGETKLIGHDGKLSKRGYMVGQFAKFIRPGAQRVDATQNPSSNVYLSAYKSGSGVVIVAVNSGSSAVSQQIKISGGTVPASFTPHITSASKSISTEAAVKVSGGSFSYSLPAQSVTTFVSN